MSDLLSNLVALLRRMDEYQSALPSRISSEYDQGADNATARWAECLRDVILAEEPEQVLERTL